LAGLRLHNSAPARQAFSEYLGLLASSHRAYTTLRTGWHQVAGADVFVLPDGGIGGAGTEVVMQGVTAAQFHQAGDLNAWQNEISKLCLGNRLPAFAISAAFAAPLIELTGDASASHKPERRPSCGLPDRFGGADPLAVQRSSFEVGDPRRTRSRPPRPSIPTHCCRSTKSVKPTVGKSAQRYICWGTPLQRPGPIEQGRRAPLGGSAH
jgi:hypothetical protein